MKERRKLYRLKSHDYSSAGIYFVTLCTKTKGNILGNIDNGKMILNEYGKIANKYWLGIPKHYENVDIDAYMVMPDHIHGLIVIYEPASSSVRAEQCSALTDDDALTGNSVNDMIHNDINKSNSLRNYGLLSKIIKSFKEAVTKEIRNSFGDYNFGWLRSYHDHILRRGDDITEIRRYIFNNPINWNKAGGSQ
ncbi:MAG: transposase [Brevinematales bacterium]